jgi:ribosome biogenesis GTPase A
MTTLLTFMSAAPRVRGTITNSLLRSELLYTYTSSIHQSRNVAFVSTALQQVDSCSAKCKHYDVSTVRRYYASKNKSEDYDNDLSTYDTTYTLSGYQRPKVNWYPGHIAKAERQLSETLKSVDVVIEVRDARAPKATAHPSVGKWTAGRPRVVVLTRADTVTSKTRDSWRSAYDRLGADRWEEVLGGEEKNRNVQWRKERSKYSTTAIAADESEGSVVSENDSVDNTNNSEYMGGVEEVLFVDAKRGQGTHAITRAVYKAGRHVNERRNRRGLNDRPLRVGIIGFPNVGKSALINRLLGRKRAKTANTPGVTRSLQWIRVATDKTSTGASGGANTSRSTRDTAGNNNNGVRKSGFELLDSPGIIPSDMLDQNDALLLAACNSIGVGAYDNQAVASYLCDRIQSIVLMGKDAVAAPLWREKCIERYGFDPILPLSQQKIAARWGSDHSDGSSSTWIAFAAANQDRIPTGEDMLFIVADNTCNGDPENAARKILQDFRMGRMGPVALQLAPDTEVDDGQTTVNIRSDGLESRIASPTDWKRAMEEEGDRQREEIKTRSRAAMDAAREKGLDLPPVMASVSNGNVEDEAMSKNGEVVTKPAESDIGKGLFDGW